MRAPSPTQRTLLNLMRQGVIPTYRPKPSSRVVLPDEHDEEWRRNHGGKPVQMHILKALENRGLIRKEISEIHGGKVWRWRAVDVYGD